MPAWVIVLGALLLPFVCVTLALGLGQTIELSRRHPTAPAVVSIFLGFLYMLPPMFKWISFSNKNARVWAILVGIAWILTGFVQLFQVRRQQRNGNISSLSENISGKDN